MTRMIIDGVAWNVQDAEDQQEVPQAQPAGTPAHDPGTQQIVESTELGQSLNELNKDEIEKGTRMSGIDMRARLHPIESAAVLALDALVGLQVLPESCLSFTRQKKRLSVSNAGKGREEIVDIVSGKRQQDAQKGGMGDFMGRMMGRGGGGQ